MKVFIFISFVRIRFNKFKKNQSYQAGTWFISQNFSSVISMDLEEFICQNFARIRILFISLLSIKVPIQESHRWYGGISVAVILFKTQEKFIKLFGIYCEGSNKLFNLFILIFIPFQILIRSSIVDEIFYNTNKNKSSNY